MEFIRKREPVARKDYPCEASEWLVEDCYYLDDIGSLTFSEKKVLVKARRNNWKVKKGDKYIRFTQRSCEGQIFDSKVIPEIHAICLKYDIYENDYC